jgi:hypothetical protein
MSLVFASLCSYPAQSREGAKWQSERPGASHASGFHETYENEPSQAGRSLGQVLDDQHRELDQRGKRLGGRQRRDAGLGQCAGMSLD